MSNESPSNNLGMMGSPKVNNPEAVKEAMVEGSASKPNVEEPAQESAKEKPVQTELPKVEEPVQVKVETPVQTESPKVEEPVQTKTEPPKVEEPVQEPPKVETPVQTESPKVEEPVQTKTEPPKEEKDPDEANMITDPIADALKEFNAGFKPIAEDMKTMNSIKVLDSLDVDMNSAATRMVSLTDPTTKDIMEHVQKYKQKISMFNPVDLATGGRINLSGMSTPDFMSFIASYDNDPTTKDDASLRFIRKERGLMYTIFSKIVKVEGTTLNSFEDFLHKVKFDEYSKLILALVTSSINGSLPLSFNQCPHCKETNFTENVDTRKHMVANAENYKRWLDAPEVTNTMLKKSKIIIGFNKPSLKQVLDRLAFLHQNSSVGANASGWLDNILDIDSADERFFNYLNLLIRIDYISVPVPINNNPKTIDDYKWVKHNTFEDIYGFLQKTLRSEIPEIYDDPNLSHILYPHLIWRLNVPHTSNPNCGKAIVESMTPHDLFFFNLG